MTWKKKWILPCLLAVFLTGCQGGKQEIPYISDGSVSWDAVEKAEIYGGGCAVPPTGTISGENGLEELVEAALETEGYRLLPEKKWLEGTMDLWVRFVTGWLSVCTRMRIMDISARSWMSSGGTLLFVSREIL